MKKLNNFCLLCAGISVLYFTDVSSVILKNSSGYTIVEARLSKVEPDGISTFCKKNIVERDPRVHLQHGQQKEFSYWGEDCQPAVPARLYLHVLKNEGVETETGFEPETGISHHFSYEEGDKKTLIENIIIKENSVLDITSIDKGLRVTVTTPSQATRAYQANFWY